MKTLAVMLCLLVIGCAAPCKCTVQDSYNNYGTINTPEKPEPKPEHNPKITKRTITRTYRYIPADQVPKGAIK
jgi:hypothetical protein